MKRRVVQRGQWPRSSDFASFLLLLLVILPVDLRAPDISIDIFENQLKAFLFTTVYLLRILRRVTNVLIIIIIIILAR